MIASLPFTIPALQAAYAEGATLEAVVEEVYRRIAHVADPAIFLHLREEGDVRADARALGAPDPARPLWGIPFVVKDNIDVGGLPTTAACPAYACAAETDAFVVARLRAAGALLIGKTNLDQFATGLVGLRSPYGAPKNAVDPALVPGGSSSGSAVAVGHGFVAFSLGTDTAGSGRVPAALNNIVGLKPTLGSLSATGVVPACRTLDTVSVFALTVEDAYAVFAVAAGLDPADAYSRDLPAAPLSAAPFPLRVGIPSPETAEFFGDDTQRAMFEAALTSVASPCRPDRARTACPGLSRSWGGQGRMPPARRWRRFLSVGRRGTWGRRITRCPPRLPMLRRPVPARSKSRSAARTCPACR